MKETEGYVKENKPSSHREFFQRIYGSPNSNNLITFENRQECDVIDIPRQDINQTYPKLNGNINTNISRNINRNNLGKFSLHSDDKLLFPFPVSRYNFQLNRHYTHNLTKSFYNYKQSEAYNNELFSYSTKKKRKDGKLRRRRTIFTNEQTMRLENEFQLHEYIPRDRRRKLAQFLRLTETQIKIWFQNRRAKYKRIEKAYFYQRYRNYSLLRTKYHFFAPIEFSALFRV